MAFIRQSLKSRDIVHLWCHSDVKNSGVSVLLEGKEIANLPARYSDDPLRQHFTVEQAGNYEFRWDEEKIKLSLAYYFDPQEGVDAAIKPLWSCEENAIAPNASAYHFTPTWGWMNDPNGVCKVNGVYHLYYQSMPHIRKRRRAALHWGHATSRDGLSWTHLPIFLSPREEMLIEAQAEGGAYSGSALVNPDGSLRIFYTDHEEARLPDKEWQMTCLTHDTIAPATSPQAIIKTRPDIAGISNDLRDPYVFKGPDGLWKMLLGSRSAEGGIVLLYETRAEDAATGWTYVGQIASFDNYGSVGVAECPCMLPIGDDLWAMPLSLICYDRPTRRRNLSLVQIGRFDGRTFTKLHEGELDYGPDFYAFQGNIAEDGSSFGIAWAAHWPEIRGTDCIMSMSLPRQLQWRGDHLATPPFHETQKLRQQILGDFSQASHIPLPEGTAEIEMELATDHTKLDIHFDIDGHHMAFTLEEETMTLTYDSHATSPIYRAKGKPGNMDKVNSVGVNNASAIEKSCVWNLKRTNFGVEGQQNM